MIFRKFLSLIRSSRLTPYLLVFVTICLLFTTTWSGTYSDLGSSLVTELLGALILLCSFDYLQSLRIKKAQKHEASYRLFVAYQLIFSHARKYLDAIDHMTCENIMGGTQREDLKKISFTDFRFFFNSSIFPDAISGSLVYHLYFESLFKVTNEIHQAISSLNPVYHFQIIELYTDFVIKNESIERLYNYFKSVESDPKELERFNNELLKFYNGKIKDDMTTLASKASVLSPFAKLYLLTLENMDILVKQAELVQDQLKHFHDQKAGKLIFEFARI